jgi:hypothetical protein
MPQEDASRRLLARGYPRRLRAEARHLSRRIADQIRIDISKLTINRPPTPSAMVPP